MRRRLIALVAGLALAGVGTFVLVTFVRSAEDRARAGEEQVPMWVVQAPIEVGTAAGDIAPPTIQLEQVPAKTRPAAALWQDNLAEIEGLVASVDLVPGEPLLASRFVAPAQLDNRREGLPTSVVEIPEGFLEVPIRLAPEQALGGIIAPGDTVAVVVSLDDYVEPGTATVVDDQGNTVPLPDDLAGAVEGASATHIILHRALVSQVQSDAVPELTAEEGQDAVLTPSTSFLITFALAPDDVERVVHAAQFGRIWLAYQDVDAADSPSTIVTTAELFSEG